MHHNGALVVFGPKEEALLADLLLVDDQVPQPIDVGLVDSAPAWLAGLDVEAIDRREQIHDAIRLGNALAFVVIVLSRQFPRAKLMNSEAELAAMVERATAVLAVTKPSDVPRERAALDAAMDAQSRVWALVSRQHEEVWRYAALLYGRQVDELVPPLGSRLTPKRRAPS